MTTSKGYVLISPCRDEADYMRQTLDTVIAQSIRPAKWWKRSLRGGYAFAEGAHLHGAPPERHWVKESRRAWVWGLLIPVIGLSLAWVSWAYGLMVFIVYLLQISRLALRNKRQKSSHPWTTAFFLVLGKFPEMLGQMKFQYQRLIGSPSKLIEYK